MLTFPWPKYYAGACNVLLLLVLFMFIEQHLAEVGGADRQGETKVWHHIMILIMELYHQCGIRLVPFSSPFLVVCKLGGVLVLVLGHAVPLDHNCVLILEFAVSSLSLDKPILTSASSPVKYRYWRATVVYAIAGQQAIAKDQIDST